MPRARIRGTRLRGTGVRSRTVLSAAVLAALALGLAACGDDGGGSPAAAPASGGGTVVIGAASNGAARQVSLPVSEVARIRAELPARVRDSGKLTIGVGYLPGGAAPIAFLGSDQKTLTGSEPDLGRLVAAVLGLKPVVTGATFQNLFVGIDSGRTDVAFSNVTDTQQRQQKYDFASYREDNLGVEVRKNDPLTFDGDYHALAGRTVAVRPGTSLQRIALDWQRKLKAQGSTLTVKYYQDPNSTYLALSSGRVDAYLESNPAIAYHVAKTAGTPQATRVAGVFSGAGTTLQGLICATTKKGDGLVKPVADAINQLIQDGTYARWLAAWHLQDEAVPTSRINAPGLPDSAL
ncbi:transporter substrate-binding domain-containing protein [Streptomyces sp. V4-01]|uniref:Transporter substrate-binding domain-containing protein n=1 Tax=Actinacidiphila polyblastidii TaxID=3110430 RepID=A0ABU7PE99_9ACTN|nr:transporter substrate-binding domain-containing protein [Streptomyces sp. V4-01]